MCFQQSAVNKMKLQTGKLVTTTARSVLGLRAGARLGAVHCTLLRIHSSSLLVLTAKLLVPVGIRWRGLVRIEVGDLPDGNNECSSGIVCVFDLVKSQLELGW
jgi:hypothetical protein